MKVILAGLSKTGTTTLTEALRQLSDINVVYHYMDHYGNLGSDWIRICEDGGTIEDFRRMYQGVDAVSDSPTNYFWEEMLEAFPEAKVILTMRDDEVTWFQSVLKQQAAFNTPTITLLRMFSPSYRRFYSYSEIIALTIYGTLKRSPYKQGSTNELLCRMTYRRHNAYVMQKVPQDKLLVYNVKNGWKPLCEFLNLPIPSTPFPHENKRGTLTARHLATDKLFLRMQREMYVFMTATSIVCIFGAYKLIKSSFMSKLFNHFSKLWA